jgi:hypothetical protein
MSANCTLEILADAPTLKGVELESLAPFDTICVQTRNSNYRIFLLDPITGRALVEGGSHFAEPVEAQVNGSSSHGSYRVGWIGVGSRIEFWANGRLTSTSPVQSLHIKKLNPT